MVSRHLGQINVQIVEAAAGFPQDINDADPAVVERVFESYTIERQQDVHRAALPEFAGSSQGGVEKEQAPDDEDPLAEFLFGNTQQVWGSRMRHIQGMPPASRPACMQERLGRRWVCTISAP
jgi:hypothetical protein